VTHRANDGGELVHAVEVHADAHRLVDVLDKLGRVVAARPRARVEHAGVKQSPMVAEPLNRAAFPACCGALDI